MKLPALLLLLAPILHAQNVVVLDDATTYGGHSDGPVYVQSNWYGSSYEANQHAKGPMGIYLGGENLTTAFLRPTNGTLSTGSPAPDFAAYSNLSTLYTAPNAQVFDTTGQNLKLTAPTGITYYTVSGSAFGDYKTLDITGPGSVVFIVQGDIPAWRWSVNGDANRIVWNASTAQTVNINDRSIRGSLLAPDAYVTQHQNIDGFLLAEGWTVFNAAEVHWATLPAVPEAGVPLLSLFSALMLLRRRR